MRTLTSLAILFGFLAMAQAQSSTVTWVGQFPREQAEPIVELFNTKYAPSAGFNIVYISDNQAITDLLEGHADPSFDLVHMKDADMLNTLNRMGLTAVLTGEQLEHWPQHLKDSTHMWAGLVKRARIIYYNSELVSPAEVATYESLGNPKFQSRLCLRQKKAQYTMGLNAFLLGVWGEAKLKSVLNSWARNSEALPMIEKDLDGVIANIENGTCLVGVANTYYYVRHLQAHPHTKVKPSLPNQSGIGAHVNVDGIAVLSSSRNHDKAQTFANWLMTAEPQLLLSNITGKHPVNPRVRADNLLQIFGEIVEAESFNLNLITDLKDRSLEIATEAGLK